MFTGLVEAVGTVRGVSIQGDVTELTVSSPFTGELKRGDSVAVSGVCTTVTCKTGDSFTVQLTHETMSVSRFASLKRGDRVNLERALAVTGRLDGHIVSGHVDGTAVLSSIERDRTTAVMRFCADEDVMRYIVRKGSVCVDGISLTVADEDDGSFAIAVIPETLRVTTLGDLETGDVVNIETDILGRYVEKMFSREKIAGKRKSGLDEARLREMGWF